MSEDVKEDFVEEALESEFVSEEIPADAMDEIPDFDDLPDMEEAAEQAEKYGVIEDDKKSNYSVRMAFVGAGQGGSNLADSFWKLGYRRVLAINTAEQDMKSLKMNKANQYCMEGYSGAGKNPQVGKEAVEKHYEDVLRRFHKCFGNKIDHIMICIGGGGGTGTGSAEILINIAEDYFKEHGLEPRIGCIVTTPEKTEKGAVQHNARVLIDNLIAKSGKKSLSPTVIVDNDQIAKFFPNEAIANFYPKSNQIVSGIFDRFNTITAYASPIGHNVDKADFQSVLSGGIMTYGQCKIKEIKDESSLSEAIVKNIQNTLLCPGFDLSSASNAMCLIIANEDELNKITKDAVSKALESLSRVFSSDKVKIHLGIYKAPSKGISICTAVSGVRRPSEKLDTMKRK